MSHMSRAERYSDCRPLFHTLAFHFRCSFLRSVTKYSFIDAMNKAKMIITPPTEEIQELQLTSPNQLRRLNDDLTNDENDDRTCVEAGRSQTLLNRRRKWKNFKSKSKSESILEWSQDGWCCYRSKPGLSRNRNLWLVLISWILWYFLFIVKFHPSKHLHLQRYLREEPHLGELPPHQQDQQQQQQQQQKQQEALQQRQNLQKQQKDQQHHPQLPSSESPPPISASETSRRELENFNRKNIPFTQEEDTEQEGVLPTHESSVRLEFLHIPKTGGTAVETAGSFDANISWGVCHFHFNFPPRYQRWEDLCPHDTVLIPELSNLDNGNGTTTNDRRDIWPTFPEMIGWWHYPLQYLERDYISTKIIPVNPYTHTTFENNPQTQTVNKESQPQQQDMSNRKEYGVGSDVRYFAVIRNPFDRMVSEYYYKYSMRTGDTKKLNDPRIMNGWIQYNLKVVMGIKKINQKYSPHTVSTSKSKNSTNIDTQAEQDPKYLYQHLGGHFIPQYDFIFEEYDEENDEDGQLTKHPGRRRRVHHVLKFENLTMEFNELMDYYGISLDFGKSTMKSDGTGSKTRLKGRTLVSPPSSTTTLESSSSKNSSLLVNNSMTNETIKGAATTTTTTAPSNVPKDMLRIQDLDDYSRKLIVDYYYKDFLLGNYSMTID